jgi:glucose/arabinose dehydrogenase
VGKSDSVLSGADSEQEQIWVDASPFADVKRRTFLATCSAALASASGCVSVPDPSAQRRAGEPIPAGPTVGLEPVLTGPSPDEDGGLGPRFPVDLAITPDGEHRYVVDRLGVLWAHGPNGFGDGPALDISVRVPRGGEKGMFAVALHPQFESNGKLYLRYSAPKQTDTPENYSHVGVISEYTVGDDRSVVPTETERTVLSVAEPGAEHNGGALTFGPDGYLYASFGEGQWIGSGEDVKQAEDWYDWNPGGNGQDVEENLLGSVLRLDVDSREDNKAYGIPEDNPLVGEDGLDEQYAWGFRNPWRMGFSGDDLFVADVGEIAVEEVNRVVKGGNYGWSVREGTTCFNRKQPGNPGPWCPEETPDGEPLRDPVIEYPHEIRTGDGIEKRYSAVIGGYVYGNDAVGELSGDYVFADFSGTLLAATPTTDDSQWPIRRVDVSPRLPGVPLGFARDPDGELLVLSAGGTGRIDRIVPAGEGGGDGE